MCNRLFISGLIWAFAFISPIVSQQNLHAKLRITSQEKLDMSAYLSAITDMEQPISIDGSEELRQYIIATLGERLPEISFALQRSPEFILNDPAIAELLIKVLKEEVALGISPSDNPNWENMSHLDLKKSDLASIEFLYGYDLFRKKKFQAAIKSFDKALKHKSDDFEYAAYYAGISSILLEDYTNGLQYLTKIGKTETLIKHSPYYLAISHFALKDYTTIIKYYAKRVNETKLFKLPEIIHVVAMSQYYTGQFNDALASILLISTHRKLTADESYIKAILDNKLGNTENSLAQLSQIKDNSPLHSAALQELAIIYTQQNKLLEALQVYEQLENTGNVNPYDIKWNQLVLHYRLKNYDKCALITKQLQKTHPNPDINAFLATLLSDVEHMDLFKDICLQLNAFNYDHNYIKGAIYNRAMGAIKTNQPATALSYFDLYESIFPNIDEHANVAAWRGILAYDKKEFVKAQAYFERYNTSKSSSNSNTTLLFDVNYMLAYCYLKDKQLKKSLGQFGVAYKSLEKNINTTIKEEDVLVRIGDIYFLLNDYTNALASYDKAFALDQKQLDYILFQKSIIAELENRYYDQILLLDELLTEYSSSLYRDKALLMAGNTLFTLGRLDNAGTYYKKLIRTDTQESLREEAQLQLGLIHVNAGEYSAAEKWYKQILASSNNHDTKKRAHLGLKEIYADYTFNAEAYISLEEEKIHNSLTAKDSIYFALASKFREANKLPESIVNFSKIITDFPDSRYIHSSLFQLAEITYSQHEYAKSLQHLRSLVQLKTNKYTIAAFDMLQEIVYTLQSDFSTYKRIDEQRKSQLPNEKISAKRLFRMAISDIRLNEVQDIEELINLLDNKEMDQEQLTSLCSEIAKNLIVNNKWLELTKLFVKPSIKHVASYPQNIYYMGLAYFSLDQFDKSQNYITNNYQSLLSDPAWFAKSLILISDVYIIQNDFASAKGALQALIESESAIPQSLKETAKNRLSLIKPTN